MPQALGQERQKELAMAEILEAIADMVEVPV
jgi:hypothetical protein